MMVYLDQVANSRENNLNLIRAVAATAVLVSHAYPISLGPGALEPLKSLTGYNLGSIAVIIFFVISGFLIAMSFERTKSRKAFLAARVLRLYPGLLVSLLLVAFVLGPLVSQLAIYDYLTHPETFSFLIQNTVLITPQFTLPGVFEDQPFTAVEGSIWTLFYEVVCYLGVFVAGVIGILRKPMVMVALFAVLVVAYLNYDVMFPRLHPKLGALLDLSTPFAIGVMFYLFRTSLPLTIWGCVALSATAVGLYGTFFFDIIFVLALGYTTFWLAYIPKGALLAYNQLGDYSYGIYIYAFPIQGFVIWLYGDMTPMMNIALSFPLTLALSVMSWHMIEKPALALRRWFKPVDMLPAQTAR